MRVPGRLRHLATAALPRLPRGARTSRSPGSQVQAPGPLEGSRYAPGSDQAARPRPRFASRAGGLALPGRLPGPHLPLRPPAVHLPLRPPAVRWPLRPHATPWPLTWVDVAWVAFSLANLAAIVIFARWETVPFHMIWISLTLLYGFRVWSTRPTLWVLSVVIATTFAAIAFDVWRGFQTVDELNEVPLMAIMFWLMVWHAQRRLAADTERDLVSEENARLLTTQRRFLQDASHQLRTPITIALGHAELLARDLAGRGEARDIEVVVGELTRLRRLGERLLVIAASEDPEFLHAEPVALERFTMEVLRKWRPTAERRWQLGRLDAAVVNADAERLSLAVDALLENAVRHTTDGDAIRLSVVTASDSVRMIVSDTGAGIPPTELEHIFARFRTAADSGGSRGTGLGLALVRAVAHAHGGEVTVRSTPGAGSEFSLVLPSRATGTDTAGGPSDGLPLWPPRSAAGTDRTLLEDPWRSGTR